MRHVLQKIEEGGEVKETIELNEIEYQGVKKMIDEARDDV